MSGTEACVLRDWDLRLDVDDVLRGQGSDPAVIRTRRPKLVEVAEWALAEGRPLLEPLVIYRRLPVEAFRHWRLHLAGGHLLSGELVARHLASAQEVIALVCSVGQALEEHASRVMATSVVRGLALDGLGSAAAEALATEACQYFERQAAGQNLSVTIPLSPGMIGWPVDEGQAQIFALFEGDEIAVTLTDFGLMLPRKSLSMVLGLGPDVDRGGRTCDYCQMKDRCHYQERHETISA